MAECVNSSAYGGCHAGEKGPSRATPADNSAGGRQGERGEKRRNH